MLQEVFRYLAAHSGQFLLAALVLGLVAVVVSIVLLSKTRSTLGPLSRLRAETDDPSQILPAVLRLVEQNESRIEELATNMAAHIEESHFFVRYVGLVRYDAFEDIAGQQSYSMCLLDSHKNGVVMTYLTAKASTRSYAVVIKGGEAHRKLSDEEGRAMEIALSAEAPVTQAR
ncbi:MAG: DUF4446 family protein [Candidatus Krumholzibacteria bacterium]